MLYSAPMGAPTKTAAAKRKRRLPLWLLLVLLTFNPCTAVAVAVAIRVAIVEAFEIDGPSSSPGYQNRDRVAVWKTSYGLFLPFTDEAAMTWGTPALGDVVIARSPADGIDIIKRVVALPGDTIEIRDGALVRNGQPVPRVILGPATGHSSICVRETLDGLRYTILEDELAPPMAMAPITLPAGHVFLLGDNRHRSHDSRVFGPVPITRLKGRVGPHYLTASPRVTCPE